MVSAEIVFFGREKTKNAKSKTVITAAVINKDFLFIVYYNWLKK